mmetsp:Transcript_21056/g.55753  ORF Transcript_21056/g.55753 Transcript_21056/m.55753 type:complete len:231 (+) Transcript_21056:130-822(+)
MKRQTEAVAVHFAQSPQRGSAPASRWSGKHCSPTKARTPEQIAMPAADHIRSALRPFLSTRKIAGMVARMFTTPATAVNSLPACSELKILSNISGPSYMKAFIPHSCCNICSVTPIARSFSMSPEKNSPQLGAPDACSASRSLQICASSIFTSSSGPRTRTSVASASSHRPLDMSQRGERGMTMPPRARKSPGTSCMRMTQRQPPTGSITSSRSRADPNASMIPMVIASW